MSEDVKPRRAYNSTRRQEQARQTRRAVLAAAHRLFVAEGYAGTTMGAVAAEAEVSVETVYKAFATKARLAKAVFDVAVVGDDEDIPMLQRELVRVVGAEPDPRRKLLVVRAAAASDPAAAEVWQQLQAERLTGMTAFAAHLAEGGHLRPGVSAEEARDVLWTHNSVELWDLLVNQRGWTDDRFGQWVAHQLAAALL
jgi:AcrR family transcriptional regulator